MGDTHLTWDGSTSPPPSWPGMRYPISGRMGVLPHQEGWAPMLGRIGVPPISWIGVPLPRNVDRQRHLWKQYLPHSFGMQAVNSSVRLDSWAMDDNFRVTRLGTYQFFITGVSACGQTTNCSVFTLALAKLAHRVNRPVLIYFSMN